MIRKDEKTAVIEANRTHATDTGSPEVQIAILTARINELGLCPRCAGVVPAIEIE